MIKYLDVKWANALEKCRIFLTFCKHKRISERFYLRNRSALAVNCSVIMHCLEVSCQEDQITSTQPTSYNWWTNSELLHNNSRTRADLSILTHNKRWSLQLHPNFCHCTEEFLPIVRLRRMCVHVFVTFFKRKNDVTPSRAMNYITNDVNSHAFSSCFQKCELLFDISLSFTIDSIGEVC